jgi:hypothetical protein
MRRSLQQKVTDNHSRPSGYFQIETFRNICSKCVCEFVSRDCQDVPHSRLQYKMTKIAWRCQSKRRRRCHRCGCLEWRSSRLHLSTHRSVSSVSSSGCHRDQSFTWSLQHERCEKCRAMLVTTPGKQWRSAMATDDLRRGGRSIRVVRDARSKTRSGTGRSGQRKCCSLRVTSGDRCGQKSQRERIKSHAARGGLFRNMRGHVWIEVALQEQTRVVDMAMIVHGAWRHQARWVQ